MRRIKKKPCEACGKPDCPGWNDGDPFHEYRGKGEWTLGCHCGNCKVARTESGGFTGALADHIAGPSPQPKADDIGRCPICAEAFHPADICATDIEMGTCHAECLDGAPVVDLDTGDEIPDGKISTYPYSEVMDPPPQERATSGTGE